MHNFIDGEIVHGDLKAVRMLFSCAFASAADLTISQANVLIRDRTAYVCDFGLSHVSDTLEGCTTVVETPWRWQAPELLGNGQKTTPEGDVYAFGCVFLEVCNSSLTLRYTCFDTV